MNTYKVVFTVKGSVFTECVNANNSDEVEKQVRDLVKQLIGTTRGIQIISIIIR